MQELEDLSGPFNPNLKFEDFSKNFLLKLMKVWQYAWLIQSQSWQEVVRNKCGTQVADEIELEAWLKIGERVNPRYAKVGNIQLNTVVDSLKALQLPLDNSVGGLSTVEYEIKNPNHVIMTMKECPALTFFEQSAPERIYPMCHVMEPPIIAKYMINPKLKTTPLKLPPVPPEQRSPGEIACQWEFKLEA